MISQWGGSGGFMAPSESSGECLVAESGGEWAVLGWLCWDCRFVTARRGMRDRWVRRVWAQGAMQ